MVFLLVSFLFPWVSSFPCQFELCEVEGVCVLISCVSGIEYVREEADCRLYWTKAMISDVREVWKAAAHAKWNGGKCVAGGF